MPPSDFHEARSAAPTASSSASIPKTLYHATVDGRPYLPTLTVDAASPNSTLSVARAAASIVFACREKFEMVDDDELGRLEVKTVSGGITNSLYRVSGLKGLEGIEKEDTDDSVLVRVFGAEGMIDRDVENSTLAALCDQGVADRYLGRFSNGRLEGWLDGYRPLAKSDLADPETSGAIAVRMANLHSAFAVPDYLREHHDPSKPGMWTQLHSWMEQARSYADFQTPEDTERAIGLNLAGIESELTHLETDVVPTDARVAFCHNDLLAANIMKCPDTGGIQLIDFEYGGVNFVSFDIANHFNEFAGGTTEEENGVPDYGLFPSEERQLEFVTAYVRAAREGRDGAEEILMTEEEEARSLLREVHAFILANHLYWGLWAVNQAAMEGCEDFDYLTYAASRFGEYYGGKARIEKELVERERDEDLI